MILGLHPIDILIIVAALLGVIAIGLSVSRKVSHEADFFVGGRKMGPVLQFFLNFGNMTDSNGAPMIASEVYRQGAAGLWVPFQPLFSTPFYWFSSIWWRRSRLITGADQFIERFNSRKLAVALALWLVAYAPIGMALGNMVSYKVAAAMFIKPVAAYTSEDTAQIARYEEYRGLKSAFQAGSLDTAKQPRYLELSSLAKQDKLPSYITYIDETWFYIIYNAVVLVCITLGGIKAAAYTDILQGLLIIGFSVAMIPIGLVAVGGISGLHAKIPAHFFDIFGTSGVSDYTWYSVAAFVLMGLVCVGNPVGCGTARDEKSMRIGVLGGAFAKRFVMIMWMFCGLIAVALFGTNGITDADATWGLLSIRLLPVGLMGLMIAGILLGHMPSVGKSAIDTSAAFTRNLYEPFFPGRSEGHYMLVAKLAIILVLVLGILVAEVFQGIIALFTTMVAIGAFLGALGMLMLFWRGLSARATGVGWVVWLLFLIVIPWTAPRFESLRCAPSLLLETPAHTAAVTVPASAADVAAGKAPTVGAPLHTTTVVEPVAVMFDHVITKDGHKEGSGRFHIELWLLERCGLPVQTFSRAGLNSARWLVDALGPFVVLIGLSLLLPSRRPKAVDDAGRAVPSPEEYAREVMNGNLVRFYRPNETAEQEQVRLDRFYGKLKTPIAPTPEADEAELAATFADPGRFDHTRLLPRRTRLEFTTWTRFDTIGFLAIWAGVGAVLLVLWATLNLGA